MSDDRTKKGPRDSARINLGEDYEVRYWTAALGVSAEELHRLVARHGNSTEAVKRALGKA